MPGFTESREVAMETPFGAPSDVYVLGKLEGRAVAFLARHGRGHTISPAKLNFRANIYGMKMLGVERIMSLSAVGSLKEEHRPGEFVIVDQFVDRTKHRISTFFNEGVVAHVALADPTGGELSKELNAACDKSNITAKPPATNRCMDGPQLSTKSATNLDRSAGW